MAVIRQRTFVQSPTTDRCLCLAKEEFVRQLDWTGVDLTSWNSVRVCMSAAIQDTGGGNVTSDLFIGLCSGTAQPYGSNTCLNAVGHLMTGTWSYNAGGGNPYYSNGSHNRIQKVNTTVVSNGAGGWTGYIPSNAGSIQRRGWYGPRFGGLGATSVGSFGQLTEAAATAQVDVSNENFLYSTNQGIFTPIVVEVSASLSGPVSITGLAAGWNTNPLNAINIYWSSATYALEIYMIAVTLF